jgi:hypothetical protein
MSPFSTEKGGVFSILARLAPVVAAPASRETLTCEQLAHHVSRVYVSILYASVVNGLNKLQERYSGRDNLRVTMFRSLSLDGRFISC